MNVRPGASVSRLPGRSRVDNWRLLVAGQAFRLVWFGDELIADLAAAHAQMLWVTAWTAAPVNIDAFKAADTRLATTPPCHSHQ